MVVSLDGPACCVISVVQKTVMVFPVAKRVVIVTMGHPVTLLMELVKKVAMQDGEGLLVMAAVQGDSLEKTVRMRVDIACLVCIVIQFLVYAKMVASMAGKACSAHKNVFLVSSAKVVYRIVSFVCMVYVTRKLGSVLMAVSREEEA